MPITTDEDGFEEVTDPEEIARLTAPVVDEEGFEEVTDPEEVKRLTAPVTVTATDEEGFEDITDPKEVQFYKRAGERDIREKLKTGGYTSGMSSVLGGGEKLTGVKKGFLERTKDALNAAGRDIANEFSKPWSGLEHTDPKKMEEEGRMRLNSVIGQEGSREKARKYLKGDRFDVGFDALDKNALALLDKQDAEFESMGITDPKERERYLKDTVKENMWTAEDKDTVRKLSTGEIRINPAHIFGRRDELVKEITKQADDETDAKEAISRMDAMRAEVAATKADNLWYADKDYQAVETRMEEAGVTDKAAILDAYSEQQRKRGNFKKLGDMLISAWGEAGTGIAKTAVGTAAGLSALVGADETAASLGGTQRMLGEAVSGSQEASNIRGLTGGFQVGKDLISSGLQMSPMLIGGWAAGGLKGITGAVTQGMAVYGTSAAQGYESKLADAVSFEQEKYMQPMTEDQIAEVLGRPETQTAAFLNAAQTALLSKVMGGGVERAALGKAAQSMTVKDFIKGGGMAALRDGTLRKELGGMLKTIRTDFTDEMAEETANSLLDSAIDIGVLDQEMKLGDLLGEAAYGGLLGGPLGGLIPQGMSRKVDPTGAEPIAGTAPVVTPAPEPELKEISRRGLARAASKRLFELRSKQEGTAGDDQTIGTAGRTLSPSETAELELLEKASADDDYEGIAGVYGFKIKPPTVVTPVEKAVDELLPTGNPVAPASVAAAEETPTLETFTVNVDGENVEVEARDAMEAEQVARANKAGAEAATPQTPAKPNIAQQPAPLTTKDWRGLYERAEDKATPKDRLELRRLAERRQKLKGGLQEAQDLGDKVEVRAHEDALKQLENQVRKLAGEAEIETEAPITEAQQEKARAYHKAEAAGAEAKIKAGEELTDNERTSWVIDGRDPAELPKKGEGKALATTQETPVVPTAPAPVAMGTPAAPAAPTPEAAVTPEQLKAEFNLTDEQAAAAAEFGRAMGIPAGQLLMGNGQIPQQGKPAPVTPTEPLPVKTELPTGSLPKGQTPTSGDVGVAPVAQKENLPKGSVVFSDVYKSEGNVTIIGEPFIGATGGLEYPAMTKGGRSFNLAAKWLDKVVSTPDSATEAPKIEAPKTEAAPKVKPLSMADFRNLENDVEDFISKVEDEERQWNLQRSFDRAKNKWAALRKEWQAGSKNEDETVQVEDDLRKIAGIPAPVAAPTTAAPVTAAPTTATPAVAKSATSGDVGGSAGAPYSSIEEKPRSSYDYKTDILYEEEINNSYTQKVEIGKNRYIVQVKRNRHYNTDDGFNVWNIHFEANESFGRTGDGALNIKRSLMPVIQGLVEHVKNNKDTKAVFRNAGNEPQKVKVFNVMMEKAGFVPISEGSRIFKWGEPVQPSQPSSGDVGGSTVGMTGDDIRSIVDTADAELPTEAQEAVTRFTGFELNRKDDPDMMGIMDTSKIDKAASGEDPELAGQLEKAFSPVRETLRQKYGDTVTLYRSQDEGAGKGDKKPRKALSWTLDPQVADAFAGVRNIKDNFSEQEISDAEKAFNETGRFEIRKGYWLEKKTSGEYGDYIAIMDDEVGGEVTDTNSVREFLEDLNERRTSSRAANDKKKAQVRKEEIPLDDVMWITDRGNQMEFVVRTSSNRPLDFTPPTNSPVKTETPTAAAPKSVSLALKLYKRFIGKNLSPRNAIADATRRMTKEDRMDAMEFFTGTRTEDAGKAKVNATFKKWLDNDRKTLPKEERKVKARPLAEAREEAKRLLNSPNTKLVNINKVLGAGVKLKAPPAGMLKILQGLAKVRNLSEKQMEMRRKWIDYSAYQPKSAFGDTFQGKVAQELHSMIFTQGDSTATLDDWAGTLGGTTNDEAMIQIMAELNSVARDNQSESIEDQRMAEAEAFQIAMEREDGEFVTTGELAVGDTIVMEGETLEVTFQKFDGDGRVEFTTLKGKEKFGQQVVEGDVVIGVESSNIAEKVEEDMFAGEDTPQLETQTEESITAEKTAQDTKAKIAEKQARPLSGSAGDLTADMFGEGETPLFNERRDNPANASRTITAPKGKFYPRILPTEKIYKEGVGYNPEAKGFRFYSEKSKDISLSTGHYTVLPPQTDFALRGNPRQHALVRLEDGSEYKVALGDDLGMRRVEDGDYTHSTSELFTGGFVSGAEYNQILEKKFNDDKYRARGRSQSIRKALNLVPASHSLKPLARQLAKLSSSLLDSDTLQPVGVKDGEISPENDRAFRSFKGFVGAGKSGVSVNTLIHEAVHTLTADAIDKHVPSFSEKFTAKEILDVVKVNENTPQPILQLIAAYESTLEQLGLTDHYLGVGRQNGIASEDPDITASVGGDYSLANLHEFVAQAFSSEEFQQKLKGLKGLDDKSMWSNVVDAIRSLLGIPKSIPDSMLESVLRAALDVSSLGVEGSTSTSNIFGKSPLPQTADTDAAYLAAVESGDMETAQRMVNEAAREAGYDTSPLYHGTDSEFNTFNDSNTDAIYLTSNMEEAEEYGERIITSYTESKKPYIWDGTDQGLYEVPYREDWRKGLTKLGYDSIVHTTDDGTRWVIPFKSSQIKSADPVTYDADGNVIPLSERFNPAYPDIRYQLAPDSPESVRHAELEAKFNDGTITPEETAEAQALVDAAAREAGYSVKAYHGGANVTEFNVFPMFLSPYRDVAVTYERDRALGGKDVKTHEVFIKANSPASNEDVYRAAKKQGIEGSIEESPAHEYLSPGMVGEDAAQRVAMQLEEDGFDSAHTNGDFSMDSYDEYDSWTIFNPSQIKSAEPFTGVPLDQRFNPASPDIRYQFAGEKANIPQFMRDSLDTAKAMAADGKTSEEIRAVTGWFPGKYDGKMRWEIPDTTAEFSDNPAPWNENQGVTNSKQGYTLADTLDHPALFEAYPMLKDISVNIRYGKGLPYAGEFKARDARAKGGMYITATGESKAEALTALLHEVQHAIQTIEGFAKGGNPEVIKEQKLRAIREEIKALFVKHRVIMERSPEGQLLKKLQNKLKNTGGKREYKNTAGEIESRDVEARSRLTPEQLAAVAPYSSENIDPKTAITLFQKADNQVNGRNIKGATVLNPDGTITITGGKLADFSTAVHEQMHAFELAGFPGLTESQVAELKAWAGAPMGDRSRMPTKASEKLARGWENYLATGKAPKLSLQPIFDKMAKWMLDIYGKIKGSDIDVDVPANIQAIFDSIAGKIDPEVFTKVQERVDNPSVIETDNATMSTEDGSPLPPAIEPTPENIAKIGDAPAEEAVEMAIGVIRGMMEQSDTPPPAPTYPETEGDWNPDNLYSLQERRALEEAEQYGYDTDWKQAQRTFGENFARAYAAEEQWKKDGLPETAGSALIERLEREGNPNRVLTDQEIAHLTIEGFRRKIELDKGLRGLAKALESGSKEELEAATALHDLANLKYQQVLNLAARSRTASGRSLNAWKQAIAEDFSPATLFTRQLARVNATRLSMGETPLKNLPEAEMKAILEYSERMLAMQAADRANKDSENLSPDERTKYEEQLAEQDALIEELLAEKAQSKKARATQDTTKRTLTDRIKKAALEARERLKAAGDPDILYQLAPTEQDTPEEKARWYDKVLVMAEPYMVDTAMSAARFTDLVRAKLGNGMVAVAERLRIDVDRYIRTTEADITGKEIPSVEKLRAEMDGDTPVDRDMVYDLARAHIFEGARKSEVIDKVTATIQEVFPSMTRAEVSQLFTDYGVQNKLNPDELAKALRTAKSIELVQKQIDDLEARKTMMKTGRAKDQADIDLRQLRKKRDDLAKSIGYNPTNRETQMASAQSAARNRMKNEIAELQKAIDSGVPRVRVRRGVEYSEDMKTLRDELEALRESYAKTFGTERSPAERNALLIKDLDRRIAKQEELISKGLLTEPKIDEPPFSESPEVQARREKLAALREQHRALHAPEIALNRALAAAEAAIKNRQATIERGGRPKEKGATEPIPVTEELDSLWKAADAMDDYIKELRKNLPLTPAQEAKAMQAAYDRAIQVREALKQRIADVDLTRTAPVRRVPLEERTRLVRQENAELQKQITQMQKDAKLGQFSDEAKEARRVGGLEARIAEIKRKRAAKDYAKKPRIPVVTSAKISDLELEMAFEKRQFDQDRAEFVYNNLKGSKKLTAQAMTTLKALTLLNLSGDIGIENRQLGFGGATLKWGDLTYVFKTLASGKLPKINETYVGKYVKAWVDVLKNPRLQNDIFESIFRDPRYAARKRRGFKLLDPHDTTFEVNADNSVSINPLKLLTNRRIAIFGAIRAIIGTWAKLSIYGWTKPSMIVESVLKTVAGTAAIMGAKGFIARMEAANATILNLARWDLQNLTEAGFPKEGTTEADYEEFMDDATKLTMLSTGQFTGTSDMSKLLEQNIAKIGRILKFPNHNASKAAIALGMPFIRIGFGAAKNKRYIGKKTAAMHGKYLAIQSARIAWMAFVFGTIKALTGDDEEEDEETSLMGVVTDPRSPHYGAVKIGPKTFVDITGTQSKWWRFIARMTMDETLNRDYLADGYVVPKKVNSYDQKQAFQNFTTNLLNPNLSRGLNLFIFDRFYEGGDLTKMNWANRIDVAADDAMMNLTYKEMKKNFEEHGAVEGALISRYLMFGDAVTIRETSAEAAERKAKESERYTEQ